MMRVVGGLENLRRAPGPKGEVKKIPRPGGFYVYIREDHGSYFPFPASKCAKLVPKSIMLRRRTAMQIN